MISYLFSRKGASINSLCLISLFTLRMINNGVYRAGFARTQEAYDGAVQEVFSGLDKVLFGSKQKGGGNKERVDTLLENINGGVNK